jgi:hypothetical protein
VLRIYAFGYGPQHDATGTLHNEAEQRGVPALLRHAAAGSHLKDRFMMLIRVSPPSTRDNCAFDR